MKRAAAAAALATLAYAVLGIARHRTFRSTGFDLGIFDQATWHYSRLEAPASSLKGLPSLLGDHFSPILVLLAPVRLLGTEALIVAQAILVCAAALPIFAYARRRVTEAAAIGVIVAYLLFGGVQAALWFDVHEIAFAPLLIALAVDQLDRGHRRASFAAVAALLLVKEDLALLVGAFGVVYALRGDRRLGALTAALGVTWLVVSTQIVVPHFAGGQGYGYFSGGAFTQGLLTKARTLAYTFGAFLGLPLLSPLVVLAVPLLAERLLSTIPQYWTLQNHYSLTIAPVLALAAADGLARLSRPGRIAAAVAALAVVLVPAFPIVHLLEPGSYRAPAAYRQARAALARIPARAPVSASNRLVAHLSARDDVQELGPSPPASGWVVAATQDASRAGVFPNRDRARVGALVAALRPRSRVVYDRGGLVVLELIR